MTKHKGKKKLKNLEVTVRKTKASDFPQAPGLLARMLAGDLAYTVHAPKYKHVADGHD